MWVWVVLTLLIGTQSSVLGDQDLQNPNVIINHLNFSEFDTALDAVLKNLLVPASYRSVHDLKLRKNYGSNNHILFNLTAIGSSILNEIKSLSQSFGIIPETLPDPAPLTPYRADGARISSLSFEDSIYQELFGFPWNLVPIALRALADVKAYAQRNNYTSRGYVPWTWPTRIAPEDTRTRTLKTVTVINTSKHYMINLRRCLSPQRSRFNVARAAIGIAKYPPQTAATIIKNRFKRSVPRHPDMSKIYNEYEAMTCHALSASTDDYRSCLRELKRIGNCLSERSVDTGERRRLQDHYTRNIWPSAATLVNDLDSLNRSCKIDNGTLTINCFIFTHFGRHYNFRVFIATFVRPSKVGDKTSTDGVMKLMRRSSLVSNVLDEIGTYLFIYQQGALAQRNMSVMVRSNPGVQGSYKRLSETLEALGSHLITAALGVINDIRATVTSVEGTLVRTMSEYLGVDYSEHMRTMRCFDRLFTDILKPWFGCNSEEAGSEADEDQSEGSEPSDEKESAAHGDSNPFGDYWGNLEGDGLNEEHRDLAMRHNSASNLIRSLKRLSQTTMLRKQSTIASLANTFLLATMFYECITVLAATIYRTDRTTSHESTVSVIPNPNESVPPNSESPAASWEGP